MPFTELRDITETSLTLKIKKLVISHDGFEVDIFIKELDIRI